MVIAWGWYNLVLEMALSFLNFCALHMLQKYDCFLESSILVSNLINIYLGILSAQVKKTVMLHIELNALKNSFPYKFY